MTPSRIALYSMRMLTGDDLICIAVRTIELLTEALLNVSATALNVPQYDAEARCGLMCAVAFE